ncbi:uncharacterized protein PHALS_14644 [Plasmopara halstedii]|uniref:Uncharacterized protein n=1 Tax=Plasmopara halstedii TaxID=4781 RepID=A0A0P1AN27_PLAHL|nr:uncharacterized protein PHALS_14644 [Plasmopara halstedii]CEG42610.1 hypothetical protein PHALS_14644 [Plasmopara halstedii]|eukprot:XP_024578979.1 hypothetical protein PHALS_14644 [Plasmopara halstedii]
MTVAQGIQQSVIVCFLLPDHLSYRNSKTIKKKNDRQFSCWPSAVMIKATVTGTNERFSAQILLLGRQRYRLGTKWSLKYTSQICREDTPPLLCIDVLLAQWG